MIGFPFMVVGAAPQAETRAALVGINDLLEVSDAAPVVPARSFGMAVHEPFQEGGAATPIAAWVRFCEQFTEECAVDPREPAVITLTPQVWKTILAVNRRVNERIHPITDIQHHRNIVDLWQFPDNGMGDCEDYQLLKRKMLVERGLPRRAMRMTVVIDELGEGHAVLTIRTDRGNFILDNKTSSVLPEDQTGYTFVKRESDQAVGWVSLSPRDSSPVTTAKNR